MLYDNFMRLRMRSMPKYKTASGYPCTFSNTNSQIENYRIYGDSTQETRSGKNLLHADVTTLEFPGVTLTYDNGTITLNGTCDTSANFELGNIVLSAGTYTLSANANKVPVSNDYAFVQLYDSKNNQIIQVENSRALGNRTVTTSLDGKFAYRIRIDEGTTYDNVILKPQLEVGSTATEYEQYGVMPSPEFPSEVQSVGDLTTKNLLPYPYYNTTKTINGVTFTDNGDGSITVNGTATNNTIYALYLGLENVLDKTKVYTMSVNVYHANAYIYINLYKNENLVKEIGVYSNTNYKTFNLSEYDYTKMHIYYFIKSGEVFDNVILKPQLEEGSTATEYEPYHKYKVPIKVSGKNLLPNSDWMSGAHQNGFDEYVTHEYITEYTQNSISFNLAAWKGVSSPRFPKDSVKRIIFKINQTALNSDSYANFYISIQGYDDNNNKVGNQVIYDSAVADKKYVFDFSAISTYSWYANSTQFSFCILARKNALSNLMVYDIAYYAEKDSTEYEPYIAPVTTNIYLDEPLRKVGAYADYIDYKNQKVFRQIEVLDGTGTKSIDESLGTLTTPIEESVYLPPLSTVINGTNIVTTGTTVEPSNITVRYGNAELEFEGYPCTFSGKVRRIRNYQVYGDSTQKTRSGKNLLPYPYSETTKTENGVTFTDNGDGTITVSGTATDDVKFYCRSAADKITISSGTYTMSGCPNGGSATTYYIGSFSYNGFSSGQTFTVTDTTSDWFYIMIKSGATVNNLIFKPQLELGSTATSYEQYGAMPSPEFPSEIQSVGDLTTKNLLPNDWEIGFISTTSGANQSSSTYVRTKDYFTLDISKNYYISSDSINTNATIYWYSYDENKNFISRKVSYKNRTIGTSGCQVIIPTNAVFFRLAVLTTDTTIKVQIEEGSTATEYEPYHKYKVPIKVSGKNLLSKWYSNMHYSGCTKSKAIYMEPGTYNYHFERVDDTVTKWRYAMSIFDVDGGENDRLTNVYSYLATFTTNGWYCNNYGMVQTGGDITYGSVLNVVFTILKPCYILWMLQLKNSSGTILDAKKYAKNVMLEKGNQYTGYEDYAEPMSKNIYLSSPLRKIGDYADYIDYKNQKVVRNIGYVKLDETSYWTTFSGRENLVGTSIENSSLGNGYPCLSNISGFEAGKYSNSNYTGLTSWSSVGNTLMWREDGITVDAFKERLATTPMIVAYIRATPIEESIYLPPLSTVINGTNIVATGATVEPSNIKIKYKE